MKTAFGVSGKHIYKTNKQLRKFLDIPQDKKVTIGYFSVVYIFPDKWFIKWVEQPENKE